MREILLGKVISTLQHNGFSVSPFLHSNTCFDLIARRNGMSLIVKVFENIDALRQEHALELQKLGAIFGSTVLIVGEKSKSFELQDNVIYSRYGISTINYSTLTNFFSGEIPYISYFKGKEIVELDSEKLHSARTGKRLSLDELAERLGTTKESVYRYEQGAKTTLATAKKLEDFFSTNFIKQIDLLAKPRQDTAKEKEFFTGKPEDSALEKMHSIGFRMETFKHTPFKALSNPEDKLMITPEKTKAEVKRKAILVKKTKDAFGTHSVIITKEDFDRKNIGGIALVQEEELDSYSRIKELFDLIKKREKE